MNNQLIVLNQEIDLKIQVVMNSIIKINKEINSIRL